MKSQTELMRKGLLASLLASSLLLSVGCAKKSGFEATETPPVAADGGRGTPVSPDTDGPRGSEFASGATAAFQVDSAAALTAYVASHPVNNPQDMRVSVKLVETAAGSNQFYGQVMLSYSDNGQYYTGKFKTEDRRNPTGSTATAGNLYPGVHHAYYNNWLLWNGKYGFHGFFQDSLGAVMLVIDATVDQGDGAGATEVSGSIWFKNYANSMAPPNAQSIPCWFLTAGPYDCRTFLKASGTDGYIDSGSALYPTDSVWYTSRSSHPYHVEEPARGWRRLGTFSGLNKAKAFSQQ